MQLVSANVLADQDRRLDNLAQFAMAEGRRAAVLIRILEPQVPGLITRPADLERVRPGVVFTGRVEHQVHAGADSASGRQHRGDLALDGAIAPPVDLECRITHVAATHGELGKRFRRAEPIIVVAVVGAGVRGQGAPETAK